MPGWGAVFLHHVEIVVGNGCQDDDGVDPTRARKVGIVKAMREDNENKGSKKPIPLLARRVEESTEAESKDARYGHVKEVRGDETGDGDRTMLRNVVDVLLHRET